MKTLRPLMIASVVIFVSPLAVAGKSFNNQIDWIAVSSALSSTSHFVQWKNPLEIPGECAFGTNGVIRTRISTDDKDLLSLLLTAYATKSKVSFYYSTTTTSGELPGHGTGCQITNAWIMSG